MGEKCARISFGVKPRRASRKAPVADERQKEMFGEAGA